MGFSEDERIRNKNKPKCGTPAPQPINFVLSEKVSLAKVLEILKEANFKVTLDGKNTVVIE